MAVAEPLKFKLRGQVPHGGDGMLIERLTAAIEQHPRETGVKPTDGSAWANEQRIINVLDQQCSGPSMFWVWS